MSTVPRAVYTRLVEDMLRELRLVADVTGGDAGFTEVQRAIV